LTHEPLSTNQSAASEFWLAVGGACRRRRLRRRDGQRRPSDKGYLGLAFVEYLQVLDVLVRRERIEKAGGTLVDYPPVLERLGVSATDWEKSVRLTSRRFSRELDISAKMFAEARRRG